MGIADLFIRRPIMTTLVMLTILLFGIMSYRLLPVSDLPNVDRPVISVSASLPGASPETMASSVATPLEKEFCTIAGIDSMSSASSQGSTSITLQFTLDRDIDAAAQDVQSAIARAIRKLPANMTTPPSFRKVNPASTPILWLSLTDPKLPMNKLDEFGQTIMAQRISMVNGVAQVQVQGSQKKAVRIELDPQAMAYRGIGIDDVANAIVQQNVNLPLGMISGPHQSLIIQDNGQLLDAEKYASLIVAYRDGKPVRVEEIGRSTDSVENDKQAAWYWQRQPASSGGEAASNPAGGPGNLQRAPLPAMERAIVLSVQRQPGTNTVEVADAVKALLPEFRSQLAAQLSAGATLNILRDSSVSIRDSAHDVQFTLYLTLGLVIMVIFLFLRNFSATVIPSLVLPMSIVGTFIIMYTMKYSMDNLSLMAITLSVGFVVDDAIVMLENIVRHLEMGKSRLQAALEGSREIGFTIVSMTLSLAAVFIPVLFMGGMVGRLFREFAVTIGAAVLVSGFVSLTLTPMLCSRFLREQHRIHHGIAYRATEAVFQLMVRAYGWSLSIVLRHRFATLVFSVAVLGVTFYLAYIIPKGFIPSEDREMIQVTTEAAQDISFDSLVAHQNALAEIVKNEPNVERFMCTAGGGGGGSGGSDANTGGLLLLLKPRDQRTPRNISADQIIEQIRPKLMAVPGMKSYPRNPPAIQISSRQSKALYQLTLQGPNTDEMYKYAEVLEGKLRELPNLADVNSDMQLKNPQLDLNIDRDRAFVLGLTPMQIETALTNAYGTTQITTMMTPTNQYRVIMELLPEYQRFAESLNLLYVRSSSGQLVPLSAVVSMDQDLGPLVVNHTGQMPSVTLSFNIKPGVALSSAMDQIDQITRQTMPDGLTIKPQGTAQEFQDSLSSMGILLVLAVVVIYVVLGILYESFYHPITILSALPFAGAGAIATLMLFNMELSLYAFVGIIMLVGLVKKNGIMMVDFAIEAQRKEGKNARDAIHEACIVRFRPIMMTTMAALMAGIPIAVGYGAGGESRQPLGLAVVGGLLVSQTLTLFVTPVFYLYMESLRNLMSRIFGHHPTETPKPEPQEVLAAK